VIRRLTSLWDGDFIRPRGLVIHVNPEVSHNKLVMLKNGDGASIRRY
jgi:hypothetical protein